MVSAVSGIDWQKRLEELECLLRLLRAVGAFSPARRLILLRVGRVLRAVLATSAEERSSLMSLLAPVRNRPEGDPRNLMATFNRQLELCDNRTIMLAVAATWPELALALLREPFVKSLHPALIGSLVRHPEHEAAMIELALTRYAGDGEIVHLFVEAATSRRRWQPLHAAAEMLKAHSTYEPVTETVVRGHAIMSDLASAERVAVEALVVHQTAGPLFVLLQRAKCPLPEGAIEGIARLPNAYRRSRAIAELREAGYAAEARQIEARLDAVD